MMINLNRGLDDPLLRRVDLRPHPRMQCPGVQYVQMYTPADIEEEEAGPSRNATVRAYEQVLSCTR